MELEQIEQGFTYRHTESTQSKWATISSCTFRTTALLKISPAFLPQLEGLLTHVVFEPSPFIDVGDSSTHELTFLEGSSHQSCSNCPTGGSSRLPFPPNLNQHDGPSCSVLIFSSRFRSKNSPASEISTETYFTSAVTSKRGH